MSETAEGPKYYLEQVHLKGFKSIDDLSIDLKEGFNIVIGKNGAGKSNFLEFLNDAIISITRQTTVLFKYTKLYFKTYDNNEFVFEIERLAQKPNLDEESIDFGISMSQKLSVNGEPVFDNLNEEINFQSLILNDQKIRIRSLNTIFLRFGYGSPYPLFIKYALPQNIPCIDIPASIQIPIASDDWGNWDTNVLTVFIYKLFFSIELEFESKFDELYGDPDVEIKFNNGNILSKFLLENINKQSLIEKLIVDEDIVENLMRFSPIKGVRFNENINIYNDDKNITIENLKLDYLVNDHWLPWSQLSDGTKRLFHIISEVTQKIGGIILIEEPELGVHPHQFELLMQFLKEQSKYKQFIISTHSPKTLDHLDEDELDRILITTYEKDKGTTLKRLSEGQESKAKEYMKEVGFLSDYWLMSDLEG